MAHPPLLRLPTETLQQILSNVQSSDLKVLRRVNPRFTLLAEPLLFSEILLERTLGSYHKIRAVAASEKLSKHVKSLVYSGLALGIASEDLDNMFAPCVEPSDHDSRIDTHPFNDNDRISRFHNACERSYGELMVDKLGLEVQELTSAFERFPKLGSLTFDARESQRKVSIGDPRKDLTPSRDGGKAFQKQQIKALLTAAHNSSKVISAFRAVGLDFDAFENLNELEMLVLKDCKSICLRFMHAYLANFQGDQMALLTSETHVLLNIRTNQLIPWPHLIHLELSSVSITGVNLRALLVAHAETLRSLSLQDIQLGPGSEYQGQAESLWVGLFMFLEQSLQLRRASFGGRFSVHGTGVWRVSREHSPSDSLKSRIETFVVEGGECPLQRSTVQNGKEVSPLIDDASWRLDTWPEGLLRIPHLTWDVID